MSDDDARAIVERAAREAYGVLLASLVARHRDVMACEDAIADAFAAALATWPARGVPAAPVAWLRTVARNRLHDRHRHTERTAAVEAQLALIEHDEPGRVDRRAELLFACAHPAIEEGTRTALMLQLVLGLDAVAIARPFLVSAVAMKKRLVRAKRKLVGAGIPFAIPAGAELPARLPPVLDAIYAAYGRSWDFAAPPADPYSRREAAELADVIAAALPGEPEALGLAALLGYCEARHGAALAPVDPPDASRWDRAAIARATELLHRARALDRLGRYQLEAAIQAAHVDRIANGAANHVEICELYAGLVQLAPSRGAQLGYAAALVAADASPAALAYLDRLAAAHDDLVEMQSYWAVRASVLAAVGRAPAASAAYARAIELTADPRVRAWLAAKR